MNPILTRALALALSSCLLLAIHAPADAQRRPAASAPKPDKATRLNRLYADYWDALMFLDPLQATLQGDARYNDQLPNTLSEAFRQQYREFNQTWLAKVEAVGSDGLSGQDLLSYQLFVRDARAALAAQQHPSWMLPVNSYYNPATIIALLGSGAGAQPFETVKDYENWSRRALGVPALFNQAIENMRTGMAAGVVQPRALMEKVLPQLDAVLAGGNAEASLFWGPIRTFPEDFSAADRERLTAEYRRMIDNRLLPAYRALRGFIATEYLPACRDSDGLGALPDGAAWYAHNLNQSTTLIRDPAGIHAMGQDEVTRLQAAIAEAMKRHKIRGKRSKLAQTLRSDPKQRFASAEELLEAYRQIDHQLATQLAPVLPDLPLAPLVIAAQDPARAPASSALGYQPPTSADAPGVLWVNTHDLPNRPRWAITQQYLHEGLPGHHLQLGLRTPGQPLPRFRRHTGDTAFVEGWGLYAETLGSELGLYNEPLEELGWLHTALLRAARIVADTGLHSQGWSRKRAADYLIHEADLTATEAAQEVERMMAMPGQVLAPVVGTLRLQRLRENAQQALGVHFDLRAFHAEVVRDGSLPLDVLEAKVQRWIDTHAQ